MAFLNIVSIPKYIDEIRTSKLMNSFDILGFSETRLDDTYTDDELKIHGYDIFRKDRNRDGGGVCVYIRSSINCVNRKEIVPEDVEAVCLEIRKPNSRPFIVSVVSRPESPIEYFNRFEELIKAVDDEDKEHVILGDLNCCLLKKKVFDNKTKKLKSIYEAYQLSQLINEPTRITIDSKSLIDHFVTSSPDKINSSGVIHIGPSDHSLIYGIRKINPYRCARDKAKTIEIRNFKHFDQQKFVKDLLTQSWEQIVLCHDTNEMWAHWKDLFLNVLDRHAPVQSKRKKAFNVPWLTREIKDLINNRDKLKRKAMVSKLRNDWDDFKASRNKVNIALRLAKSNYYRNKIANQKNNPKEAWKTINSLLGRTKENTTVNELKFDDQSLFSQEHIAEAFNDYFSNVGPKLASSMANPSKSFEHFIKPCSAQMSRFKLVSNTKVLKLLGCLSNAKATGIDKISGKILKCAAHAISPSLTYIFNNSIISNCFPDEWKMARVLP
ncbi:uncharacterized protein LOC116618025 [Nematostella vectensis]|uniref:uncharacterized protein LOC116618025 n=1 Tax=Nematostella vectensis TaxID=45351 RepID=UPI00138FB8EE|nr:uncharacterized protein LOC116618025 [Nematostella vectensis]